MKLQTTVQDGITVITVNETRIDAAAAISFKDSMRTATQSAHHVILNLANVDFIDSSGLGAIVAVRKHLGDGRRLDLAGLTQNVEKVFRLTRMDTVFGIYMSVADVLRKAS